MRRCLAGLEGDFDLSGTLWRWDGNLIDIAGTTASLGTQLNVDRCYL
jgi:hypothetical protein